MKHSAIQELRDMIRNFGLRMDVRLHMRQIKLIVDEFDEEKNKHIYGSTFWQDGGK